MKSDNSPPATQGTVAILEWASLRNQYLFWFALILSVVPIWLPSRLPFVDMSQHAAQVIALQELWRGNSTFVHLYQINWFTPYLLGYLLLLACSYVFPVVLATKVMVSVALISFPLATQYLLKAVGADERWRWLAIPASYSFALYWGFLSFFVAVPLSLLFIAQSVIYARQPDFRRGAALALFSIVLFFSHIIVLGFASLISLGFLFGHRFRQPKLLVTMAVPYLTPVPLIGIWLLSTLKTEQHAQSAPTVYGPIVERFSQLLTQPSGFDTFSPLLTLIITGTVVALPYFSGSKFNLELRRVLPFALGVVAFFGFPAYWMNAGYFYHRLGLFLVPLWLTLWDPAPNTRGNTDRIAIAVVVAWMAVNLVKFAQAGAEQEGFDAMLSKMRPGARVASMVVENASAVLAAPVYMHFPAWYAAERAGIVDFNFADFYSQPVRYRRDVGARMTEFLGWYPAAFQWDRDGGPQYDYFVIRSRRDLAGVIFKDHLGSVELIGNAGSWWVYHNRMRPL